jgi:hypothetical protein
MAMASAESSHQVVVEMNLAALMFDPHHLVLLKRISAVPGHFAEGIHDVPRLHRTDRDGGEERVELEEVLLVDEQRVPVDARRVGAPDGSSDVQSAEAAAQYEELSLCHRRQGITLPWSL